MAETVANHTMPLSIRFNGRRSTDVSDDHDPVARLRFVREIDEDEKGVPCVFRTAATVASPSRSGHK